MPYGINSEKKILGRIDEDAPYEGRALNCLDTTDIILIHDQVRIPQNLFYKIIRLDT